MPAEQDDNGSSGLQLVRRDTSTDVEALKNKGRTIHRKIADGDGNLGKRCGDVFILTQY